MFEYFESATRQEKAEMETKLKAAWTFSLQKAHSAFYKTARHPFRNKARKEFLTAIHELGAMQAIFRIMHIDIGMENPYSLEE